MEYNKSGYPHPPPSHMAPPYSEYPQPPPPPPPQVIVTQRPLQVGPEPVRDISCPSCGHLITTKIRYEPNTKTHLIALLLFCFICWPCVCVPYCMDSCQNANHYCPNCDAFIGTYNS